MQYQGGKSRIGGRIVQAILTDLGARRLAHVTDLCSGAGGVTHRLADVAERVTAVEAHPGLVALHKAVQEGWVPPEHVSEEEYRASFALDWSEPLAAFMGFACAFGGVWRSGYAKALPQRTGHVQNYAKCGSLSLRKCSRQNVTHVSADAMEWECDPLGVVYCDPPYMGVAGYKANPRPRGDAFWRRLAEMAVAGTACYLSEYSDTPPAGVSARLVWSSVVSKQQFGKGRVEHLWRVLGFTEQASPRDLP